MTLVAPLALAFSTRLRALCLQEGVSLADGSEIEESGSGWDTPEGWAAHA